MAYNFAPFREKAKQVSLWLSKELSGIRTGRAAPTILDSISVDSYGAKMPINQVASIVVENPQSLRVTPWDMSLAKAIEKAVVESRLGLSVSLDEKGLRIMFPELTSERRQSLIKIVKQKLEEARVSLRKERDKVWDDIQSKEKEGGMGEDEKFRLKAEMQKITDETNKDLETIISRKEEEISK